MKLLRPPGRVEPTHARFEGAAAPAAPFTGRGTGAYVSAAGLVRRFTSHANIPDTEHIRMNPAFASLIVVARLAMSGTRLADHSAQRDGKDGMKH